MSSSADDISLSRLLNRRLFPALGAAATLASFASGTAVYFALRPMIPAERLADARHLVFIVQNLPTVAAGLVVLALLLTAAYIHRRVTRPLDGLAGWADFRYRKGDGPALCTRTPVREIRRLAFVFGRLFEEQDKRVRELRTLVGATRHNLRNHLNTIGSNAQFVRDGKRDAVSAAELTLEEVFTVTHILDVNAEIAKNYSRILGDPPKEVHLADLVHDCLDQLDAAADEKGVTLEAEIPPRSITVIAHRQKIESVLHNLVENAIKYTPESGSVKLAVRAEKDGIVIEVRDTGIGISNEDKAHVFEREFRAKAAEGIPGTGFGLAYVDSVIVFYGGSAEITDNHPQGTVFTIRLPLETKGMKS